MNEVRELRTPRLPSANDPTWGSIKPPKPPVRRNICFDYLFYVKVPYFTGVHSLQSIIQIMDSRRRRAAAIRPWRDRGWQGEGVGGGAGWSSSN